MSQYYSYSEYLKKTFGASTYKVIASSGLTCPTRDGSIAKRGCAFCDLRGSSSYFGKKSRGKEIETQLRTHISGVQNRFKAKKFLAYFQSYTNTYADVEYLRDIYTQALSIPEISGLCVGTRPDCLSDEVLLLLEEFGQRTHLSLELGVQSFDDPTLLWLERGHDRQCSIDTMERIHRLAPSIHTCIHLILGCPTESELAAKDNALLINKLRPDGVKLHQLMVLEHTELARRYREQPFKTVELDEYCELLGEFLNYLSPEIYVERLYATATHAEECIAPKWSCERWRPHNRAREIFDTKRISQGSKLKMPLPPEQV